MSRLICFCLLIVGLVASLTIAGPILGGVNDEKKADSEVQKILDGVREHVNKMANQEYKSVEALTYRKQVVSGANYFIKAIATANDGSKSHMHLRIYRPFRGPVELTAIRANQDEKKPLEYF